VQDVVDVCLERAWAVAHSERHNGVLIQPIWSDEG
jgi:hypothetical protein